MKTTYKDLVHLFEARSLTAFGHLTDRKAKTLKATLGIDQTLAATEITSDEGELRFYEDIFTPIAPTDVSYANAPHIGRLYTFGDEKEIAVIADRE